MSKPNNRTEDDLRAAFTLAAQDAPSTAELAERQTLLGEIAKLPRKQRTVLALRYYEGLPDAEIAAVMGCAETTVRGYAFRALKTLRVELSATEVTA